MISRECQFCSNSNTMYRLLLLICDKKLLLFYLMQCRPWCEANSYHHFDDCVLCKIINLYFEDDTVASWDTYPALLALHAWLALKVSLKITQNISKVKYSYEVGHIKSAGRSSYKVPGRSC